MQVQVKTAAVVNYDGHVLDVKPGVDYDGAFAQWLHDTGYDITVTEGEPAEKAKRGRPKKVTEGEPAEKAAPEPSE